ncbi:glycoside hydrolase family 6 protein [Xylariaceae sp. FL1651]|nr:glycoside hydrolase family 6 protein [Xylariaceae sp. FL1651]
MLPDAAISTRTPQHAPDNAQWRRVYTQRRKILQYDKNTAAAPVKAGPPLRRAEGFFLRIVVGPGLSLSLVFEEVDQAVSIIEDRDLKGRASKIANTGTFLWIKSSDDIRTIASVADEVPCDDVLGLVLDNLPYKEVAPRSPSSEYDPNKAKIYQLLYIKPLVEAIKANPNTAFAVAIEPEAFPQYFNASSSSKPSDGEQFAGLAMMPQLNSRRYRRALQDGGEPGAATRVCDERCELERLGSPSRRVCPRGRFLRPANEQRLVALLSSSLRARGMPPRATHAILDSGRNSVQGLRLYWDEWCNVNGAGFGRRPTANTGDENLDAFIWVKHPGESDGDRNGDGDEAGEVVNVADECRAKSAVTPAPARDAWFQEYFEMLVRNAHPAL